MMKTLQCLLLHNVDKSIIAHYTVLGSYSSAYTTAPQQGEEKWMMQTKNQQAHGSNTKISELLGLPREI